MRPCLGAGRTAHNHGHMLQRAETPAALTGVDASRAFFAPCLAGRGAHRLWVAHVDGNARCIHLASYDGAFDGAELPVRSIIADALHFDSAGIVLAHQRPGADARPTGTNTAATLGLAQAAEAIDLAVLDHLVFAGNGCSSFRRMGLL